MTFLNFKARGTTREPLFSFCAVCEERRCPERLAAFPFPLSRALGHHGAAARRASIGNEAERLFVSSIWRFVNMARREWLRQAPVDPQAPQPRDGRGHTVFPTLDSLHFNSYQTPLLECRIVEGRAHCGGPL
jgi:hypothetical protein